MLEAVTVVIAADGAPARVAPVEKCFDDAKEAASCFRSFAAADAPKIS